MLDATIISKVEGQVASMLRSNGIINGALLVTAISGGPDSLAMFYALLKVKNELDIQIHGAHIDHCLRGEDGQLDAKFVKELFLNAGIEFTIDARDVNSYKSARGLSEEEAAREIRYRFLGEVASAQETDCIALGHTSEDQVETVLMHIVRGSGLTGLRGMEPIKRRELNGKETLLIRPLLQLSRADTVAYCNALSLSPRVDSSNFSEKYTRNKIRHRVLPTLRELNPSINDAITRLSRASTETLEYLDLVLENIWETAVSSQIGRVDIDRRHVSNLPSAVLSHLLRKCVQKVNGSLNGFNHLHIDAMKTLIEGNTGKSINMPGGVIFEIGYDHASMFIKENKEPKYFPDFDSNSLNPSYAGIRPIIEKKDKSKRDFIIQTDSIHSIHNLINLYGIESPGLTSSLAIAEHIRKILY